MLRIEYLSWSCLPKIPPRPGNGDEKAGKDEDIISEGERAMFKQQDTLKSQYESMMNRVDVVSSSKNVSLICRAVITATTDELLVRWRRFVIDIESSILENSSEFVGGHRVVPMSKINSEFQPWVRRMSWMHKIVHSVATNSTTGSAILNLLEDETHTGYSDIQEMATVLLVAAQKAWMRAVVSWVLYGRVSPHHQEDFLIQKKLQPDSASKYTLRHDLVPRCLTGEASDALFSIGDSLNQIYAIQTPNQNPLSSSAKFVTEKGNLLAQNLSLLESLSYPLNSSLLESCLVRINQTISHKVLARMLSLDQVNTFIDVVVEYLLIGRGEFTRSLLNFSNQVISETQHPQIQNAHDRQPLISSSGHLNRNLSVKQKHLTSILNKTWTELSSLSEQENEILNQARRIVQLSILPVPGAQVQTQPQVSTFTPIPCALALSIPSSSPLNLLLHSSTLNLYASISSTFLSLAHTITTLSTLWTLSSLRRSHPSPLGPPRSSTPYGRNQLSARRMREEKRHAQLRKHWTRVSVTLHPLNELNAYWHGEVVPRCVARFRRDVETLYAQNDGESDDEIEQIVGGSIRAARDGARPGSSRPGTKHSYVSIPAGSRPMTRHSPGVGTSNLHSRSQAAPSLSAAHTAFVKSLSKFIFFIPSTPTVSATTPSNVPTSLKSPLTQLGLLLVSTIHYASLFTRLQSIHTGLDLQEDEGVEDAFSDFAGDEVSTLREMERVGMKVDEGRREVVSGLVSVGGGSSGIDGAENADKGGGGEVGGLDGADERYDADFGYGNGVKRFIYEEMGQHSYGYHHGRASGLAASGLPDINHLLVKLDLT